MQGQNEATLKSKLKVDHRNADLQRRHDALKEEAQHAQRALNSSQVHRAAQYVSVTAVCAAPVSPQHVRVGPPFTVAAPSPPSLTPPHPPSVLPYSRR